MVHSCLHHHNRYDMAWADTYAASAADTCSWFKSCYLVFCEAGQGGRSLAYRHIYSKQRLSHHRTAGNNLLRLSFETACCFDQFLIVGSQFYAKVLGLRHSITCNSNDLSH